MPLKTNLQIWKNKKESLKDFETIFSEQPPSHEVLDELYKNDFGKVCVFKETEYQGFPISFWNIIQNKKELKEHIEKTISKSYVRLTLRPESNSLKAICFFSEIEHAIILLLTKVFKVSLEDLLVG